MLAKFKAEVEEIETNINNFKAGNPNEHASDRIRILQEKLQATLKTAREMCEEMNMKLQKWFLDDPEDTKDYDGWDIEELKAELQQVIDYCKEKEKTQ